MRKINTAIGVLLLVGAVMPATSRADDAATAKAAYEQGKQLFAEGKYEEAIEKFTESYNLSTEPNLLFNLAKCAEQLGDADRAIAYYEVYLEELPDAPDAEEIRKQMALLESGEFKPAPASPPPEETPPEPVEPAQTAPAAPRQEKSVTAEEFYKSELEKKQREPFWPQLTIGLGGMVVAGGVITAVLAHKEYKALKVTCKPECTDDDLSTARGLAVATDVQIFLGGAATVAGLVGFFVLKRRAEKRETPKEAPTERHPTISLVPGGLAVQGRF